MDNETMRTQSSEALRAFNLMHSESAIAILQVDSIYRNTRVFWWGEIQYQILVSMPVPEVQTEPDEVISEFWRVIEAD